MAIYEVLQTTGTPDPSRTEGKVNVYSEIELFREAEIIEEDGSLKTVTVEPCQGRTLKMARWALRHIRKSTDLPFVVSDALVKRHPGKERKFTITYRWRECLGALSYLLRYAHDRHIESPDIELFKQVVKDPRHGWLFVGQTPSPLMAYFDNPLQADLKTVSRINRLIEDVRQRLTSGEHFRMLKKWRKNALSWRQKLYHLEENWFSERSGYARLLMLRLNLRMSKNKAADYTQREFSSCINNLLNNLRSKTSLSRHLVGYMCKLEHSDRAGYHAHFIFAYDGSKVRQDIVISHQIGKYWVEQTENEGIYYSCNARRDVYDEDAIGMIHHADHEKRRLFRRHCIGYLLKMEQHLKTDLGTSVHSIRRSNLLPTRHRRAGRKRARRGTLAMQLRR